MIQVIKPITETRSVFLGGTIDMGNSDNWQKKLTEYLATVYDKNEFILQIFNPRRDDWDSSWEQNIKNYHFKCQVNWELDYIERADVKVFYFDPTSQSPITLMELGLMLGKYPKQCVVYCPNGYWRKGNVDIICARHNVFVHEDFDEFKIHLLKRISHF